MPYDAEQAARQRAEQAAAERRAEQLRQQATRSPLRSSGGGGWQPARPDPTFDATRGRSRGGWR